MIPNAERADAADAKSALAGLVGTVNSVCGRLVSDFAIDGGPLSCRGYVRPDRDQ
jgi:hypothetical protein